MLHRSLNFIPPKWGMNISLYRYVINTGRVNASTDKFGK